ncbi:Aste57867_16246 [Aphanomyces stellatus]|uniref:Aste57867_16246 protein n=1 Tax=Aphanomyces stellatus TaxID=120398 RepID=A0A485L6W8_9STRA|nr:hypothetical protein As57867_016189 [Aphanomyces stellatus]VFT93024.1 Aste57867_16246 [Aphanomyces stellatus]
MTDSTMGSWTLAHGSAVSLNDVAHDDDRQRTAPSLRSPTKNPAVWTRGRVPTHIKQRHELEALRVELTRLKSQLCDIQIGPTRTMSYWEGLAKSEHVERLKATSQNEDLREAVASHAAFIDEMEVAMRKRPRLGAVQMEDWEAFILPMGRTQRGYATHKILDRQFDSLQNVFLRRGLLPPSESTDYRAELKLQPSGAVVFEVIERALLAAPLRDVSAAAWRVVSGELASRNCAGFEQSHERVDAQTVYTHVRDRRHATPCHAHMLMKYYTASTRDVIVSRSILVDPLWTTHMDGDLVEDVASWVEFMPRSDDNTSSVLTVVWRINLGQLPPEATEDMATITTLLESAAIAGQSVDHGSFSPHSRLYPLISPTAPREVTLGNLRIYLALSIQLEDQFKHAVHSAIEQYKQG